MPSPLAAVLTSADALLRVEPWNDPVVDSLGHDPRSPYVERFWLPSLGPAAVLLLRRVADELDRRPTGFAVPVGDLSQWMGLRFRTDKAPILLHTIDRLGVLGFARIDESGTVAIRRRLATLALRQISRLPPELRAEHAAWVDDPARRPGTAADRLRLRRLAAALVEAGDDVGRAEAQLHAMGVHPALAHDAVVGLRPGSPTLVTVPTDHEVESGAQADAPIRVAAAVDRAPVVRLQLAAPGAPDEPKASRAPAQRDGEETMDGPVPA